MKKLAPMQQRFVEEYLLDLNATQAAIRAGYSSKTAVVQSSRLLRNVHVALAVGRAQAKRSEDVGVDAKWLLEELRQIHEADIADIVDDRGKFKPLKKWPKIWRKMLQGIDIQELYPGSDREQLGRVVKVKFVDRLKNLEMIGKHVGVNAFKELHEHTGKDGGPIETRNSVRIELVRPSLGDGSDTDGV